MSHSVEVHVLNTGWASAPEWIIMRGGALRKIQVPAMVALIRHPQHGWGLFDTGYAPRLSGETAHGPFRLYRAAAPMQQRAGDDVAAQLARFGLSPKDIDWVLISHFHPDHIAGLADFQNARWIASREAFEDVGTRRSWRALQRGFIPGLLPDDFAARATLIDTFDGMALDHLGPTYDLFGDGALRVCNLPGHAAGQIGVLAQTGGGPLLFAADACWLSRAYRENRAAHWLTAAFVANHGQAKRTLAALHGFSIDHPEVQIIPTHCPEAHARWVGLAVQ